MFLRISVVSVLLFFASGNVLAQGRIPKAKDGKVKGALVFLPLSELAKGYYTATSPFFEKTDPVLEKHNWMYNDSKNVAVRGFVKDAVLYFQWWTLFGDPIEKYAFKWTTSGYYEVMYEENGKMVSKSIYRNDLIKYPDLLERFDGIEPYNLSAEITITGGHLDDQVYADFRKRNNIMTDLGSAGYKDSYKIKVDGVHSLYAASGKDAPFVIPTMAVGGWPDFLNIEKKDGPFVKGNIELFKLAEDVNIQSFRITDIDWEFDKFVGIAKQYDRYEKKLDSPKEVAEKAAMAGKSTGGDDFWNHAEVSDGDMMVYRDPTTYKYGLKAKKGLRALPAIYSDLKPTAKKGIFLGRTAAGISAINSSGKILASLAGDWNLSDGYVFKSQSAPKDEDCWMYEATYYDNRYFENGSFSGSTKTASVNRKMYLIVTQGGETYTEEDKKRNQKRESDCYQTVKNTAISAGYAVKN
ncbi:MAG TPA: hypothetical protein VK609_16770 [Mucilaginibacter sp.]|nr:hypothetical protein [Mucilaginibacter sp.]